MDRKTSASYDLWALQYEEQLFILINQCEVIKLTYVFNDSEMTYGRYLLRLAL